MPFKSESQRKYFHAKLPHLAAKWEKETPEGKLPEKVKEKTAGECVSPSTDKPASWSDKFKGTPLYQNALELEKVDAQYDAKESMRDAERDMERNIGGVERAKIRYHKLALDAQLAALKEQRLKGKQKTAGDMPHFTEQNRPKKVKDIYKALKRDHPSMPAEMKARIAARQGEPGKQKQGPPYKGDLSGGYTPEMRKRDEAAKKGKTKKAFEMRAMEAVARTGANPYIVQLAFNEEVEKVAQWGQAAGATLKAISAGAKSLFGGIRGGATGAVSKALPGTVEAAGHQLGTAARGTWQGVGKGMQTHLGINPSGGLGQFNKDWWRALSEAQRRNVAIGGGLGIFGAGALAGRATAPSPQTMVYR